MPLVTLSHERYRSNHRYVQTRATRRGDRVVNQRFNDRRRSPDGRPASNPSTLMSSSRSSQWMPLPFPIRRQRLRSAGDACCNRGNQANGTEMLRPSLRSMESVSSVTVTLWAKGDIAFNGRNTFSTLRRLARCERAEVHRGCRHKKEEPAGPRPSDGWYLPVPCPSDCPQAAYPSAFSADPALNHPICCAVIE